MVKYFSLFLFVLSLAAEDEVVRSRQEWLTQSRTELTKALDKLHHSEMEKLPELLLEVRQEASKYFQRSKDLCSGNFQTWILTESGEKQKENRLGHKERVLCYLKVKELQKEYLTVTFTAQKKYQTHLHQSQLKAMEEWHQQALKGLESAYRRLR